MERIAILDHDEHRLYVEDINEEILEGQYGGDEEMYIEAHYDMENYSWDYIVETRYFFDSQEDSVEINFEDIKDI